MNKFEKRTESGRLINPLEDIIENIYKDDLCTFEESYDEISTLILRFANEVRTVDGQYTEEDLEWFLESIKNK